MGYAEDYKQAADELRKLYDEMEQLYQKSLPLQKRVAALLDLVALEDPEGVKALTAQSSHAQAMAHLAPTIANAIRRILAKSDDALTVREIREQLRLAGWNLAEQSNPAATIGSICARLSEQGFAIPRKKDGRHAWKARK